MSPGEGPSVVGESIVRRPSRREAPPPFQLLRQKAGFLESLWNVKLCDWHAETEKIETLGSSRMTKILEEIGAESDAGIKLGGGGRRVFSLESKGRRRRGKISERGGRRNRFPFFFRPGQSYSHPCHNRYDSLPGPIIGATMSTTIYSLDRTDQR